ncbi:MAG: hypothetical protein MZV64_27510 [Ignavibacteriales bacterium]|nr:hypothetical protein [Ignavibacteriales bacterium]
MNKYGYCSASFDYLKQYIAPSNKLEKGSKASIEDKQSFYVGRIGVLFVLLSALFCFRRVKGLLFALIFFILLALGINGPMAYILFKANFPFIDSFRQYFHFFILINSCMALMGAVFADKLIEYLKTKPKILYLAVLIPLFYLHLVDLSLYGINYYRNYTVSNLDPNIIHKFEFSPEIQKQFNQENRSFYKTNDEFLTTLLHYKDRLYIRYLCPKSVPSGFYQTNNLSYHTNKEDLDRICDIRRKRDNRNRLASKGN